MSGQDTSADRVSTLVQSHAENWRIFRASQRHSHKLACEALDAIHKHMCTRQGFNRYRQLEDKRPIDRAVFSLAKRYYRQKADYLLVANGFDRTGVRSLAAAYENLIAAFEGLSDETISYIEFERTRSKFSFGILPNLKADLEFFSLLGEKLPTDEFPYIKTAVHEAAKIYRMCSGRKASRNINRMKLPPTEPFEFESPSTEFIFKLLSSLDPSVTRSNIQTYVRALWKKHNQLIQNINTASSPHDL